MAALPKLINGGYIADIIPSFGSVNMVAGELEREQPRADEKEADLVGMELAARAGYNPAAGISLWEKMSAASKGAPPQWMSTHPSGETRIETICSGKTVSSDLSLV